MRRPDFQQAGQEHSAGFHVLSGLGLLGALPAVVALAAAGACAAAVTRLRGSDRSAALALIAGTGAFALHNQIDWEWKQTALTLLAYPLPVLVACAAGGVVARPPRRSLADRRRHRPSRSRSSRPRCRCSATARSTAPTGSPRAGTHRRGARRGRPRARAQPVVGRRRAAAREPAADARASRGCAPRRRRCDRDRAARCPRSGSRSPATSTTAGRIRAGATRSRARALLSGHDNVFADTDENVVAVERRMHRPLRLADRIARVPGACRGDPRRAGRPPARVKHRARRARRRGLRRAALSPGVVRVRAHPRAARVRPDRGEPGAPIRAQPRNRPAGAL